MASEKSTSPRPRTLFSPLYPSPIRALTHLSLSCLSFPSISLLCSFRLSSLRCCITIMASCDDDVLSSGMEMQHATAHIIKAECIRCHLCGNTAARSLCVKLFCGKQKERESDGELCSMRSAVKVSYCWHCVEQTVKISDENGLLSLGFFFGLFFAYRWTMVACLSTEPG